jgi:cytidyltransferase-like protein
MAGIKHLKQIHDRKGEEFLNNLLNNYVIINEHIDGNFFGVKKNQSNDRFKYFKKTGEITYVDRMLMKFYNPAVSHFESMPDDKRNRIPSNFYFGFQFVSGKDGGKSKYSRLPKNNLVLSYIHRLDESGNPIETLQTKADLEKWAYYLGVEPPPIIFEGKLDDEQKSAILEFVYSPKSKLEERFQTESFSKYILRVLNPDVSDETIKSGLTGDVGGIVFRFYDENDENSKANAFLAKLIDPIFIEASGDNVESEKNQTNDYIWLILIDLMNHFELYNEDDLIKMCQGSEDYDSKYISIINQAFKDFIKEYSFKYDGLELDTPEYLNLPEFEMDFNLMQDGDLKNLLNSNKTYCEIYRILSNFFRKTRKKSSSSFFTPDLIVQLNLIVKKIKRVVVGEAVYEGLFPSFGEFVGSDPGDNAYIGEYEWYNKEKGKKVDSEDVNIIIGSFQPPHNGHIKSIEALKEKNGKRAVLVALYSGNRKSPFSDKAIRVMLEKLQQEMTELIADVKVIGSNSIKDIMKELRPNYNPILWGTGEKRIKDHLLEYEYIKNRNVPLRVSEDFKLIQLPNYLDSQRVRDSIQSGDFNSFKDMVPKSIKSEFFNLKKELDRK